MTTYEIIGRYIMALALCSRHQIPDAITEEEADVATAMFIGTNKDVRNPEFGALRVNSLKFALEILEGRPETVYRQILINMVKELLAKADTTPSK